MSYGRKYVIRHRLRNRINRFTYEDYNAGCSFIISANPLTTPNTQVVVKHVKDKTAQVSSLIKEVLAKNNITVKRSNKYASSNQKYLFVFNSKADAQRAADIINKMAIPDYILEQNIRSNGDVTTGYGLKVRVDMSEAEDGSRVPVSGGSIASSVKTEDSKTAGFNATWLIIGGIAVAAVLAIVLILKKK